MKNGVSCHGANLFVRYITDELEKSTKSINFEILMTSILEDSTLTRQINSQYFQNELKYDMYELDAYGPIPEAKPLSMNMSIRKRNTVP